MKRLFIFLLVLFMIGNLHAQQFRAPEINPFGLVPFPSINDIDFVDLTGDGLFDIVFNSEYSDHFLPNGGSPGNPDFSNASLSQSFFTFDNGQLIGFGGVSYPSSVFTDLDGDGDLDHLFNISSDNPALPAEFLYNLNVVDTLPANFAYFFSDENLGADFNLPLIALSSAEVFAMADLDGDGDEDILGTRIHDTTGVHTFIFYESLYSSGTNNFSGTALEDPFGLISNADGEDSFGIPVFIDPDGDGDQDLLLSLINGDWAYYENIGDRENPMFTAPILNPFGLTALPQIGFPEAIDVNGDGLQDLMVGTGNFVYYFEFDMTSSTKEIRLNSGLHAFPNPVSHQLTLQSGSEDFESIEIISAVGQRMGVFDVERTRDFTLETRQFPPGVYTAKLKLVGLEAYAVVRFVKL
ncbi:MAG: hypothetical protein AAGG75_21300 [Bacteroidota bacterium]